MKSKREQAQPTPAGSTIEAQGGGREMIAVSRAQRELIDTLAQLVLAAVEREQHDAAIDSPTLGSAGAAAHKARGARAAGANNGGGRGHLDATLHRRRAQGSR